MDETFKRALDTYLLLFPEAEREDEKKYAEGAMIFKNTIDDKILKLGEKFGSKAAWKEGAFPTFIENSLGLPLTLEEKSALESVKTIKRPLNDAKFDLAAKRWFQRFVKNEYYAVPVEDIYSNIVELAKLEKTDDVLLISLFQNHAEYQKEVAEAGTREFSEKAKKGLTAEMELKSGDIFLPHEEDKKYADSVGEKIKGTGSEIPELKGTGSEIPELKEKDQGPGFASPLRVVTVVADVFLIAQATQIIRAYNAPTLAALESRISKRLYLAAIGGLVTAVLDLVMLGVSVWVRKLGAATEQFQAVHVYVVQVWNILLASWVIDTAKWNRQLYLMAAASLAAWVVAAVVSVFWERFRYQRSQESTRFGRFKASLAPASHQDVLTFVRSGFGMRRR